MIIRHNQSLLLVLLGQDSIIGIGYLGDDAFVHALSHRIQVGGPVVMIILARPHSRLIAGFRLCQSRNVNVETVANVDPACVDNIVAVSTIAINKVRIDIEEILTLDDGVEIGIRISGVIVINRAVVELGEVIESRQRNLGVNVPVPR